MRLFFLGLLATCLTSPIQAQTAADESKITYLIRLFDTVLTYAPPPWVTSLEHISDAETFRDQGQTSNGTKAFLLEFIPKGESFEAWSQLYGIWAETPLSDPLDAYRNGQIQTYQDACIAPQWRMSAAMADNRSLFTVFCPQYKSDPNMGEVAFFSMILRGQTLVKTYYHIRVPAFSLGDLSKPGVALPISNDQIDKAMWTIEQARLTDAP